MDKDCTDIFDDEKILRIEAMPNGDKMLSTMSCSR